MFGETRRVCAFDIMDGGPWGMPNPPLPFVLFSNARDLGNLSKWEKGQNHKIPNSNKERREFHLPP